eukprot:TRINITY_DN4681_c0_g1_i2.p1 TRINITY_DN4681_c0_g1~~TRINITY_DN4681_c0_g1_i2.p1  ORF type:complete len:881 (+),score=243.14 TRINITY_DN4681_c0_g1_i2:173-2815(+)
MTLSLAGEQVGVNTLNALLSMHENFEFFPILDLSNNDFSDESLAILSSVISTCEIVVLNLRNINLTPTNSSIIIDAVALSNTVTSLDLSSCDGLNGNRLGVKGCHAISKLISTSNVLHSLSLRDVSISSESAELLKEGFLSRSCYLSVLDLSGNDLESSTPSLISAMSVSPPTPLVSLSLSGVGMKDDGAEALANFVRFTQTLEKLDVSKNNIGPRGSKILAQHLSMNPKLPLRKLDASWNSFSGIGFGAFCEFAQGSSLITDFRLSGNQLDDSSPKFSSESNPIRSLVSLLDNTKTLQILEISKCKISPDNISVIAPSISHNQTVTSLDLSGNPIGAESRGAAAIAHILLHTKQMKYLNLKDTMLESEDGELLATSYKTNTSTSLLKINLDFNNIDYRHLQTIINKVEKNRILWEKSEMERGKHELFFLSKEEQILHELEEELQKIREESTNAKQELDDLKNSIESEKQDSKDQILATMNAIMEAKHLLDDASKESQLLAQKISKVREEKDRQRQTTTSKIQMVQDTQRKLQRQIAKLKETHDEALKSNIDQITNARFENNSAILERDQLLAEYNVAKSIIANNLKAAPKSVASPDKSTLGNSMKTEKKKQTVQAKAKKTQNTLISSTPSPKQSLTLSKNSKLIASEPTRKPLSQTPIPISSSTTAKTELPIKSDSTPLKLSAQLLKTNAKEKKSMLGVELFSQTKTVSPQVSNPNPGKTLYEDNVLLEELSALSFTVKPRSSSKQLLTVPSSSTPTSPPTSTPSTFASTPTTTSTPQSSKILNIPNTPNSLTYSNSPNYVNSPNSANSPNPSVPVRAVRAVPLSSALSTLRDNKEFKETKEERAERDEKHKISVTLVSGKSPKPSDGIGKLSSPMIKK